MPADIPHHTPLIATIVGGIVLAFIFGAIAQRLRISPLVGYLAAGVMVGPFTPGFVADQSLAPELAEIGVILLMFGVGMHFSLKDLLSVRAIAIPGAVVQIAAATLLGWGLAYLMGWSAGGGLVFGLALSVASTVVLLRALQERRLVQTDRGRIAIGWLIVEDLAMVLALVLLPPIGALLNVATETEGGVAAWQINDLLIALGITLAKVSLFVVLMLVVGRRVIPWILHYIAHTGSRELFRLGVLAIGLGVAYGAAQLFGVSFALGAFFAGMVLAESELSQRAAEESLPLRDAFAVLFFVSVGMLFDPGILLRDPGPVAAALFIIVIGKSVAAFLIVRAFRHPTNTALLIAASLAQIGEFSFILAALGTQVGLLPQEGRDLIITGAILSILVNPVLFWMIDRWGPPLPTEPAAAGSGERVRQEKTGLDGHTIVVGYGRVGSVVAQDLHAEGRSFLLVEDDDKRIGEADRLGMDTIVGNAVQADVLEAANVRGARSLVIAIPNGFEAANIVLLAKALNPKIRVVARAHSDAEIAHLARQGADHVIMGEKEIAHGMLAYVAEPDIIPESVAPASSDESIARADATLGEASNSPLPDAGRPA
jgi:CPA2 family monovalent cation:H+ antiporter-2